jgi:hypothetical protein
MIPSDVKYSNNPGQTIQRCDFIPTNKRILPFPLENIEEDIGNVYFELDKIRKRIEVVKINNVTSLPDVRRLKLKKMQYKINTAMALIKRLVRDLDDFWIN